MQKKAANTFLTKVFFGKTHTSQKNDVRMVASVRASARGRLGMWVWRCVVACESEIFSKKIGTQKFLKKIWSFSFEFFSFSVKTKNSKLR